MRAETLAKLLKKEGIDWTVIQEGDREIDGQVDVSDDVHVQVSSLDCSFAAVRQNKNGTFTFWPTRVSVKRLAKDIKDAMGGVH